MLLNLIRQRTEELLHADIASHWHAWAALYQRPQLSLSTEALL